MTEIPDSIKLLTDKQLRKELKNVGINAGPLTPTTRRLFQSKLAKKRGVLLAVVKNSENIETKTEEKCTNNENKENENPTEEKKEKTEFFYGVFVPQKVSDPQQNSENIQPMVFENKSSALLVMKEHKNARFKVFTAFEDAKNYSLNGRTSDRQTEKENFCSDSEAKNVEELNKFSSVKQEDLNVFMAYLEKGDESNAKKSIWDNPRYLITSADSPVIIKASTRYNALHIAAKYNQPQICCLVLSTLENPEFYKLLYPDVIDVDVIQQRMEHLIDLYLNTPEKGLFETPLHIASKFGFKDVISELLVYTQCCKTMKNKFGDKPVDVICSRVSDDKKKFKEEILNLLNDHYFIPLLRDFDNSEKPVVGEPWDAKECSTNMSILSPSSVCNSPISGTNLPLKPKRWLSALAGPMSKEKAKEMRKILTTPSKLTKVGRKWSNLKKIDPDKGEEHVARHLASTEGVGLLEFWSFINDYADFSQVDGLLKLEGYLARKFKNRPSVESFDELTELVEKLEKVHINSNHDLAESSMKIDVSESKDLFLKEESQPLPKSAENEQLNNTQIDIKITGNKEDLVKNLFSVENENLEVADSVENLTNLFSRKVDLKQEEMRIKDESPLPTPDQEEVTVDPYKYRDPEETLSDVFSSPSSTSYSSSNLGSTSNPGPSYSFLSGNMPTKLDRDVLLAIGDTPVEPQKFPYIYRWKKSVLEFSEGERERWGTPRRTAKSSTFFKDDVTSSPLLTPSTPSRNMRRFFLPNSFHTTLGHCSFLVGFMS